MDYREMSAKNVDEAITKACLELGITSDHLDYEVVSEGSSGFLGFGSRNAVIRYREKQPEVIEEIPSIIKKDEKVKVITAEDIEARAAAAAQKAKEQGIEPEDNAPTHGGYRNGYSDRKDGRRDRRDRRDRNDRHDRRDRNGRGRNDRRDNRNRRNDRVSEELNRIGAKLLTEEKPHEPSMPKPQRKISPRTEEQVAAIKKLAEEFLSGVFGAMNMSVSIRMEYDQEEGALSCIFDGDDMGILIGKHGQTLDSLQYLTSLVINKNEEEYIRVKLDTEDYRNRRKETLINLSRNIAHKVKQTRHAIALEPMNPYERRIIHSALQNNPYVETYSEGEEPYRHVVVTMKKSK
ncbi:MAG: RNA-binding cell elongation regulator Jag/EloR [Lachnospiraceae bacterium]|nr:RNA-binding cell elongation regulator Jag/EloR [Lachnospiraceae bacterium]